MHTSQVRSARKLQMKERRLNSWRKFWLVACRLCTDGHTASLEMQLTQRTRFRMLFSLPIRPLLAARIVAFLARLWRRRSLAHAAILAVATLFFCALRPVSRYKAALRVATAFDSPHLTNKSSRLREWLRQ